MDRLPFRPEGTRVLLPATKVGVGRVPRRQVVGEHAPVATRTGDVKNGVQALAHVRSAGTPTGFRRGDQGGDVLPLGHREVAGVGFAWYHALTILPTYSLCKQALTDDWSTWEASASVPVLEPETAYEGAHLPLAPSERGVILTPVRELRDPCIFEEAGRTWLFYVVAGEQGIAVAELTEDVPTAS